MEVGGTEKMRYHNITKDDMLQGEGIRTGLWLAGCSHMCEGCQNPITWDPNDGLPFDEAAENEIREQLNQTYIHGLTLTGGDPLFKDNREEVTNLVKRLARDYPDKTFWLYTGDVWEDIKDLEIMQYLDVVVDGPFIEALFDKRLMWKGSKNQRVIDVQESLRAGKVKLYCENYSEDQYVVQDSMVSCCK